MMAKGWKNVPGLTFTYCAAWALVHVRLAMYHSPFRQEVIEDKEGYMRVSDDIGVPHGNNQRQKRRRTTEVGNLVTKGLFC